MSNAAPVYPTLDQLGTPRSGLLQLRNAVSDYFEYFGVGAVVAPVGIKYRSFTLNQSVPGNGNRVVFIPGEFDGSNEPKPRRYGGLNRETRNHSSVVNPRELCNWDRPATVSVWAAPVPGQSKAEDATINIAEDLLEQVVRAICTSYGGRADITFGGITINSPPQENAFGVELLLSIVQRGPIFDLTHDFVQPAVKATNGIEKEMTP